MGALRFLRPAVLAVVGDELWVVDVVQPVAAALDPATGAVRRLVGWPSVPAAVEPDWQGEWRALSDGGALWVQARSGPAARVTPDGRVRVATVRTSTDTQSLRLTAAGVPGAWLVPDPPRQDITADPAAPPPEAGWSRLLLAAPDGTVREVFVEHPVLRAIGTDDGLAVAVDVGRGARRDLGVGHWSWEPDPVWLLVRSDEPVPERIVVGAADEIEPPRRRPSRLQFPAVFMWHPEGSEPIDGVRVPAEPAGGLLWRAGWDRTSGSYERRSIATGHDPSTGAVRHRVELGPGTVRALMGTATTLFLAISGRVPGQLLPFPGAPAAVLAVDPGSGAVRELLPPDSVDISAHIRRLGDPPADEESYVRFWLRTWAAEDGDVAPVAQGMSRGRAELTGTWPGTTLEITFDWAPLPGWRLRRRLPLFDELGRPTPPEYSGVHLGEDLATGGVPAVPPGATGGVLDL